MPKLDLPILTITGHYDDDQLGALTYYERHMKYGSDGRQGEALPAHWPVGPRRHADAGPRGRRADLRPGEHDGPERPAQGVVRPRHEERARRRRRWRSGSSTTSPAPTNGDPPIARGHRQNRADVLFSSSDGHANDVFRSGPPGTDRAGEGDRPTNTSTTRSTCGPAELEKRADQELR